MNSGKCVARHWLVVPAAGAGRRFGGPVPKQYLPLGSRPLICQTLHRLRAVPGVSGGVVALAADDSWWPQLDLVGRSYWRTTVGGAERCDSVLAALNDLDGVAAADDWVLVHDVARPCVMPSDIIELMRTLADHPVGGILAAPVADTIKQVVIGSGFPEIDRTLDREMLWSAQTPQMFRYSLLRRALQVAAENGSAVTDEASAVEGLGFKPRLVAGRRDNIKVTGPGDLAMAAAILETQNLDGALIDEEPGGGDRSP